MNEILKAIITKFIVSIIILAATSEVFAQKVVSQNLRDFKIVFMSTDNGIEIQSLIGSAWINLEITLQNNRPQAVNEQGMTELGNGTVTVTKANPELADYLFTVIKTDHEIILNGIEGTVWTNLSFTLDEKGKQAIDQFGMTNLN